MSETKPLSKQNKYDNSHKEAKKAQRQITNWLKAAEKEQSTGLPIGRKVKGDEKELQQRIYAAARTAKVDCLARARTFLREFNEARNAPTPPLSDPISSGEATPREEDPISQRLPLLPARASRAVTARSSSWVNWVCCYGTGTV